LKNKIRYVAVGECPHCHEQFIRPPKCTAAACLCATKAAEKQGLNPLPEPITIPLSPALLLPASIYKRYTKLAKLAEISVERLVNAVLEEGAKKKLKELDKKQKSFPQITVTTRASKEAKATRRA
jgi:hypothetical protein